MDRRRYVTFWIVAAVIWFGWLWAFPPPKPAPDPAARQPVAAADRDAADPNVAAEAPAEGTPAEPSNVADATDAADAPEVKPADEGKPAEDGKPAQDAVELVGELHLGIDRDRVTPDADYTMFATLSQKGAAVGRIELNRYLNEKQTGQLALVDAAASGRDAYTLKVLGDDGLATDVKLWEVTEHGGPGVAAFRTTALDGQLAVAKRFTLEPDEEAMRLTVRLTNASDRPLTDVQYELAGGSGIPLEGEWYTRTYRTFVVVQVDEGGAAEYKEVTAATVADQWRDEGQTTAFRTTPIQAAGVANQYFASLLVQPGDPRGERLMASARPQPAGPPPTEDYLSDLVPVATSVPATIAPGETVTHEWLLFNGPKQKPVLAHYEQFHLDAVLHYPSFMYLPVGGISRFMVGVLGWLEGYAGDYGIAIILLTLLVRACMFPISYKATKSMHKMQLLAPKMEEIKARYEDPQERNKAVMELYAKEKVNPLGGCLMPLLQMPIFIGLYQGLYNTFELRQSSFLYGLTWIEDLSAPDQLFAFGTSLPLLGPYFNLLPILAVTQMVFQMKWFTPPATTDEGRMQQKMMSVMMVVMGFFFYRVPAGLCVYFITSGLWTLAERLALPRPQVSATVAKAPVNPDREKTWKSKAGKKTKPRKK